MVGQFYNTIGIQDNDLEEALKQVEKQSERVLEIYKLIGKSASPSEVWTIYKKFWPMTPLTSIRRSISDLTDALLLERTETMSQGLYGKPEHRWKIAEKQIKLF